LSKTIVLYDGDSIAFRAAAVTEKRTVDITHLSSGRTKTFNTRTELKKSMENKKKVYDKTKFSFVDKREAEPIQNTLAILKKQIGRINESFITDEYLICLSGKTNFRDRLLLPSKYKGSRIGVERPINLLEAKKYLWKNHPSLIADDREADDDLIIKGYEYLNKGYTVILASQDKDAAGYGGLHLYDFTKEESKLELVPEFGSLWISENNKLKTIKGKGFIWFCFQWIFGDPADDYNPCEIVGIKYGQMSAYNLLKDCKTHQEALEKSLMQYHEWYSEPVTYTAWDGTIVKASYLDIADLYLKCSRMMEKEGQIPELHSFLKRFDYGIV
jgi:hypothetical protein